VRELRYCIIGCGMIVEEGHLPAWQRLTDQATLVGIADRSESRLDVIGGRANLPRAARFNDYRHMLAELKPDFADIALPHHLHQEAVLACCETGTGVLLEKPVAIELAEVQCIAQAVREGGIRFSMIHNYRTIPQHQAALAAVTAGKVGQPQLVCMEAIWSSGWAGAADSCAAGWRAATHQKRVGAINEYAYHNIYLAEAYMMSRIVRVTSKTLRTCDGLAGENIAAIVLEHENGGLTIIQAGYGIAKFARRDEVHGSGGSIGLCFDGQRPAVAYTDDEGRTSEIVVEGADGWGFDGCFAQILAYCGGASEKAPADIEVGLHVSRVIDAAYRSAASHQSVAI
jgi:predicted dehydrogenase